MAKFAPKPTPFDHHKPDSPESRGGMAVPQRGNLVFGVHRLPMLKVAPHRVA